MITATIILLHSVLTRTALSTGRGDTPFFHCGHVVKKQPVHSAALTLKGDVSSSVAILSAVKQ